MTHHQPTKTQYWSHICTSYRLKYSAAEEGRPYISSTGLNNNTQGTEVFFLACPSTPACHSTANKLAKTKWQEV